MLGLDRRVAAEILQRAVVAYSAQMAGHGHPPGSYHHMRGEHEPHYPWLNQTPILNLQPLHMQAFHPAVPVPQLPRPIPG